MFSRNQALGGELDDANKRAAAAEAEALESKQELVRQVRWLPAPQLLAVCPVHLVPDIPVPMFIIERACVGRDRALCGSSGSSAW